jgi:RNA polymerase sigma-70 factor, ECF subfamily
MSHIHELLLENLPRLHAYARRLTNTAVDAEDLVQTAAVKILNSESQFDGGTNFGAWSRTILRNSCFSDGRKARIRPMVSIEGMRTDVPLHMSLVTQASQEEHVLGREIVRATRTLRPRLRQTLMLMGEHALTCDQAAVVMSCSPGTVKSRLWRARAQMKALLRDNDDLPRKACANGA